MTVKETGSHSFEGQPQQTSWGRLFGGQVLAQALACLYKTVPVDRHVHSLHSYFLRPGNTSLAIDHCVENLLDGGSISSRHVKSIQEGVSIFTMTASFQRERQGFEHSATMPDVEGPEDAPDEYELEVEEMRKTKPEFESVVSLKRAFDLRPVVHSNLPTEIVEPSAHRSIWLRTNGDVGKSRILHDALWAYISDLNFLSTSLLGHGETYLSPRGGVATIDHSLWYHRKFDLREWHLFDIYSPSASNGRGLVMGRLFDQSGALVASAAQEGLIGIAQ